MSIALAIRVVIPPADAPQGWDAADAAADGWDAERVTTWLRGALVEPDAARVAFDPARSDVPPPLEHADADDPRDLPPLPDPSEDDAPFQCLGYDHGVYYYLARGSQQMLELPGQGHTKNALMMLAPLNYWEREYPGSGKEKAAWDMAANALMRRCERAGVFDPARARGRGAWWDDGVAVLHLGDRVIIDGAEHPLATVRSRYLYEAAAPMRVDLSNPLPAADAVALLDLCKMIEWERSINATLLAGWCVVAPVCGALNWRPHVWVVGGAGSGKTWVMDNILRRCLGDTALSVQSETTEAGLRQTLGHDARPIVFDEAEGEDHRAQQRIQNVMALMRQASSESGAAILKGSAMGAAKSYRVRSCFAFASIGLGVQQHADATRVTVLGIKVDHEKTRAERVAAFQAIEAKWLETLTEEYVTRLQARTIRLIPMIRRNAEVFAVAGAKVIGTRRLGDQLGALLAGAYALHSNAEITLAKATAWLEAQNWDDEASVTEDRDELKCLQLLMEVQVRVTLERGAQDRTLGELVALALARRYDEAGVTGAIAEEVLHRHGIRTTTDRARVLVSTTHSALARLLSNTPWAKNWGRILKRIDGAEMSKPVRFGAGMMSRAVSIPSTLIAEDLQP